MQKEKLAAAKKDRAPFVIGGALLIVLALTIIFAIARLIDPFIAFATVATAIGTLGLAFYTYRLAQSTRASVDGADRLAEIALEQLEEVRSQRDLLTEQAKRLGEQADATKELAVSSNASVQATSRARIDALAPLVNLEVSLVRVTATDRATRTEKEVVPEDKWIEARLRATRFSVTLSFLFRNVGARPAQMSFGDTSTWLTRVRQERLHMVVLEPGAEI